MLLLLLLLRLGRFANEIIEAAEAESIGTDKHTKRQPQFTLQSQQLVPAMCRALHKVHLNMQHDR